MNSNATARPLRRAISLASFVASKIDEDPTTDAETLPRGAPVTAFGVGDSAYLFTT